MDTVDCPQKQDNEFLPSASRHWTPRRYYQKIRNLTKVLLAVSQGQMPALLGLAEVENGDILKYWLNDTPLREYGYRYLITHSPDVRGINVALVYQPMDFRLLGSRSLRLPMPEGSRPTRDILHAWGRLIGGDTLDVMVCHLPSRSGGVAATQESRTAAHRQLRSLIDSLLHCRQHPKIIVMGDMNDYPSTRSLIRNMRLADPAEACFSSPCQRDTLFGLMLPLHRQLLRGTLPTGSHKYQGRWGFLDHFFVNGALLDTLSVGNDRENTRLSVTNVYPFALPFMLTDETTTLGQRPLRSYYGFKYEGGYSDHLPIVLDLRLQYE